MSLQEFNDTSHVPIYVHKSSKSYIGFNNNTNKCDNHNDKSCHPSIQCLPNTQCSSGLVKNGLRQCRKTSSNKISKNFESKDKPKSNFKIGHLNINHLLRKFDQLEHYVTKRNYDIFCVTETWLHDRVPNSEVQIEGYKLFRKDRKVGEGGGELIYVRDSIRTTTHEVLNDTDVESLWVEVKLPKIKSALVCCMYRQPKQISNQHYEAILDNIEQALSINDNIIILGDLNYDYCIDENLANNPIHYIECLYNMSQLVTSPTRVTKASSTLIDVILTTMPELHQSTQVSKLSLSDHFLIETEIKFPKSVQNHKSIKFRDYKDFNIEYFHHDLSWQLDQANFYNSDDVEIVWRTFKDIFLSCSNSHAPFREIRVKNRNNPWITKEIVTKMYRRDYLKEKAVNDKSDDLWNEYKLINKEITQDIDSSKSNYFKTNCDDNLKNPKLLWRNLKKCFPNKHNNGILSDSLTCNSLNTFYASIGNKISERFTGQPNEISIKGEPSIHQFFLPLTTPLSINKSIKELPNKSSNDVLNFDSKLIKLNSGIIAPILSHIFNLSIKTAKVPNDFKICRITPVYKGKGNVDDEASYRPISVSCHISKLLEHHMNIHLTDYLTKFSFISPDQSAYLKYHSTTTCLHRVVDDCLQNIDDGLLTGACFLDVEKCFNSINHEILLKKLDWYGVRNLELTWFRSYLKNRKQCTSYNGETSDILPVDIGIPQGAVLAPVLFLIFINDLPQYVGNAACSMFADDVLLYVTGKNMDEINAKLQDCITLANVWYVKNKLSVNISKSNVMVISTRHQDTSSLQAPKLNTDQLQVIDTSRYLGLHCDKNLLWHDQVKETCKKVSSKLFILKNLKRVLSKEMLQKVYLSCIQPYTEYGCTVWGNCSSGLKNKIQRLQNRAARIILNNFDYENFNGIDLVKSLNWLSFEERFKYLTCVLVYKAIHGLAPNYLCDSIILDKDITDRHTRSADEMHAHVPKFKTEYFHKSFSITGPQTWNSLPSALRNASKLSTFKKECKKFFA